LARLDNEQPLYLLCDAGALSCPPRYRKWRRLLNDVKGLPKADQLKRLNAGINALIEHRDDTDVFAARDYWAAPMEFLLNGGDCEDYTILKYASLLKLGYSDRQLRIAVVRDVSRRIDHAVLAVADAQGAIILDNMSDTPVSHEQIVHYRPVYSVNRHSRWVHIATRQISRLHAAQTEKAGRAGPVSSTN
ncbi:MAG: transglutaminase-like cysteine peptidase, partial [Aestuariivirgaceae bacterium]